MGPKMLRRKILNLKMARVPKSRCLGVGVGGGQRVCPVPVVLGGRGGGCGGGVFSSEVGSAGGVAATAVSPQADSGDLCALLEGVGTGVA